VPDRRAEGGALGRGSREVLRRALEVQASGRSIRPSAPHKQSPARRQVGGRETVWLNHQIQLIRRPVTPEPGELGAFTHAPLGRGPRHLKRPAAPVPQAGKIPRVELWPECFPAAQRRVVGRQQVIEGAGPPRQFLRAGARRLLVVGVPAQILAGLLALEQHAWPIRPAGGGDVGAAGAPRDPDLGRRQVEAPRARPSQCQAFELAMTLRFSAIHPASHRARSCGKAIPAGRKLSRRRR